jgi:ATP-binding cassette subfamily F protein 3
LDIYAKEVLEESLKEFKGTLLFISHDRYFINKLANRILYIYNNKLIEYYGNYDYFAEKRDTNN